MKKTTSILASLVLVTFLFSCAGPTQQERGTKTGALIGAAAGALLGQAIGRNTTATILGAESVLPLEGFPAIKSVRIWIGRNRN